MNRRRMRVLQVHCRYRDLGGEDTVVEHEATILRGAGHFVETHVVENPRRGIETAAKLFVSPFNPMAARRVVAASDAADADLAHVHNTWFALSPSVLRSLRRHGTPVVATLHNYRLACANGLLYRDGKVCLDCITGSAANGIRHVCYRGSLVASTAAVTTSAVHRRFGTWSEVDALAVPSRFARDRLADAGVPTERLHVVAHSVRDPGARRLPPSASDTVLFVGRLTEDKGVRDLVEAWRRADTGRLHLRLLGDGPLRSEIVALADPTITCAGPVPPAVVQDEMLEARVLVFPTRWYETFGRVVAEAFASQLAVLATDAGAAEELVQPALGNAWLVPPCDPPALAARLEALADDRAVDRGGAAARDAFELDLSPEAGVRRLEALYESVLG
jgi:glycosyltransferase involved in cell wall biosynthesis